MPRGLANPARMHYSYRICIGYGNSPVSGNSGTNGNGGERGHMADFIRTDPLEMLRIAAILVPLFVMHEIAHAWTAYKLGDATAKDDGRLTLNPLKHIDWLGLALIMLVGFGWAKPVMVNTENMKNPRSGMALVAAAGPAMNMLLAVLLIFAGVAVFDWRQPILLEMAFFSIMLAVFNMLPVPPLDGSKVLAWMLPRGLYAKYLMYERFGFVLVIVLVFTGAIGFLLPLVETVFWAIARFFM